MTTKVGGGRALPVPPFQILSSEFRNMLSRIGHVLCETIFPGENQRRTGQRPDKLVWITCEKNNKKKRLKSFVYQNYSYL